MKKYYYHICANGDDAKNFIICERDAKAAFNRVAICAHATGVIVLAFSIEDSHPHFLVYGTFEDSMAFKTLYESLTKHYIVANRGSLDQVVFECDLIPIKSENHLLSCGTYVVYQPTKDGKRVLPYDYLYGTGSLYFRNKNTIPIWQISDNKSVIEPVMVSRLTKNQKRELLCSTYKLPDDWLTVNGFILPQNYIDIEMYESIYKTHNSFRVFLGSNKKQDDIVVVNEMIKSKGIFLEDLEARKICGDESFSLYGKRDARWLNPTQRMNLARRVRAKYNLSFRQLSTIVRLPEVELRKYIK